MLQVSGAAFDWAVPDARDALSSASMGLTKSLGVLVPGRYTKQLSPNWHKKYDTAVRPIAQTWKSWELWLVPIQTVKLYEHLMGIRFEGIHPFPLWATLSLVLRASWPC